MFKNRKVLFALIAGILLASVAIYFVIGKKGHKKEEVTIDQEFEKTPELVLGEVASYFYDLESVSDIGNYESVSDSRHLSGSKSCTLSESAEFSVTINKKVSEIPDFTKVKKIKYSFSCSADVVIKNPEVVVSIDDASGKSVIWLNQKFEYKPGTWKGFNFEFELKDVVLSGDQRLKVYVWNKGREKFFIDDLTLTLEGLVSGQFHSKHYIPERNIEYDFETVFDGEDKNNYVSSISHSGKTSYRLNADSRYSPSLTKKIAQVIDSEFKLITMSCWLNQSQDDNEVLLVAAIKNSEGKEIFWQGRSTEKGKFPKGEWVKHRAQFKIPFETIKADDIVSVYAWNKGGAEVFVDDFLIVYGETNVRSGTNPVLDMTTISDSGLIFTENSKVLKTSFLKKYDFSGSDSLMTLFSKSNSGNTTGLGGEFISGNFTASPDGEQQVAIITGKSLDIIGYCSSTNSLNLISHSHKSDIAGVTGNLIFSGDLYGNAKDEIAIINLKKKKLSVFELEGGFDLCAKQGETMEGVTEAKLAVSDWDDFIPEGVDVAAVVSGAPDSKKGLLFIDLDSGNYSVVNFDGSNFNSDITRKQGSQIAQNSKSGLSSLNPITGCSDSDNIFLLNYVINEKRQSKVLSYNPRLKELKILKDANDISVENTMRLISLNQSDCKNRSFLSYEDSWKFSMTRIEYEGGPFSRLSNMDFSGYEIGFNPKYFEIVQMLAVRLKSDLNGIMVIFGNCNDPDYSGGICNRTDTLSKWYPRIQYYYLDEK